MEKIIKNFLLQYEFSKKKRFDLHILEKYVKDSYRGYDLYLANGGYFSLYKEIIKLKNNKSIREIKSSSYNGLNPPLKTKWQIIAKEEVDRWDKSKILQYSDLLDFSYYINNPIYQTDLEWEYIENIYKFLKTRDFREFSSIEERSLELFYDEKFLTNRKEIAKGKNGLLKRLKISHEDLKMKKYGQMFIYWNRGTKDIKDIIILENHSTFFTYKRIAEDQGQIFGFEPDIIIYGGGKKIENSFSFLDEIADLSKVKVLYFGDIDSEGFGIYARLKARYPHVNIGLQSKAYKHLILTSDRYYPLGDQDKNLDYLKLFIYEMKDYLDDKNLEKVNYIWEENFRIPQELINYEYLLKVME